MKAKYGLWFQGTLIEIDQLSGQRWFGSKGNNKQASCVSVRELGMNLRNCVSSNPHFFRRDRSRDRSLGLDKLVSGEGDKLLGKYLKELGRTANYLGSTKTLENRTRTVPKEALHGGT